MNFDVLQYGYLGLLALLIYMCYKIISDFHKSQKPFIQTLLLVLLFLGISIGGGVMGYFWAEKELEVAAKKESSLQIIKGQVQLARERLDKNTLTLKETRDKALKEAANTLSLDSDRDIAFARSEKLIEMIQIQEKNFHNELNTINKLLGK